MRVSLWTTIVVSLFIALPPFLDLGLQNMLVQVLIAALFAVSFNLLVGQAGMLSFGHAAFFGVGAFSALHLMEAIEGGMGWFPTPLIPLAGALGAFLVGIFAGFFASRRSGVYFALVTLAIAELLHSLAPLWDGLFGGESGLSTMRMPWGGASFGSTLEVYYLTLAWTVISIGLLYALTRTPFGRLTLALRENEQRVWFLGYNVHLTKVLIFSISALFTGIAGSLLAISNETANYTLFSLNVSAQVVLHTFVGGSMVFLGPAAGAAVFVIFAYLVSDVTRSWLLYQGLIFILVMLYAPHGIGGVVMDHIRHWNRLDWRSLAAPYARAAFGGLLLGAAVVYLTETLHFLFSQEYEVAVRNSGNALPNYELFGVTWDPLGVTTWLVPAALLASGFHEISRMKRHIGRLWETVLDPASSEGKVRTVRSTREAVT